MTGNTVVLVDRISDSTTAAEDPVCEFDVETLGTELLQASLLIVLIFSKLGVTSGLLLFEPLKLDNDVIGSTVFDFFV